MSQHRFAATHGVGAALSGAGFSTKEILHKSDAKRERDNRAATTESYAAVARAEGFHPDTLHRWRTRGRDADRKRLTSDGSRLPKQPGRKRASIGRCDGEASRVLARMARPALGVAPG